MPFEAREQVGQERVTGELVLWKGNFGWIRPQTPIDHPDAAQRGGKVYIAREDIEGPWPDVGDLVTFLVYSDDSGLGATRCRVVLDSPKTWARSDEGGNGIAHEDVIAIPEDATDDQASAYEVDGRTRMTPGRVKGVVTDWDGIQGTVELEVPVQHPDFASGCSEVSLLDEDVVPPGSIARRGTRITCFVFSDDRGLGAEACIALKGGSFAPAKRKAQAQEEEEEEEEEEEAEEDAEERPAKARRRRARGRAGGNGGGGDKWRQGSKGPDLPRQRITDLPISGQIISWKGKVGWIKPDEPLDHELAKKHEGDIYLHHQDVLDGVSDTPEKGKAVNFHAYVDSNGVGAEEVILL
mmetsp:Transcript_238/g.681  ORF Transcript_238/g.681 Transcript_238/m.681 type:complete len:353 (+) Transcript_238:103-1161(+)